MVAGQPLRQFKSSTLAGIHFWLTRILDETEESTRDGRPLFFRFTPNADRRIGDLFGFAQPIGDTSISCWIFQSPQVLLGFGQFLTGNLLVGFSVLILDHPLGGPLERLEGRPGCRDNLFLLLDLLRHLDFGFCFQADIQQQGRVVVVESPATHFAAQTSAEVTALKNPR